MTKRIWLGLCAAIATILSTDLVVFVVGEFWGLSFSTNVRLIFTVIQVGCAAAVGSWIAGRDFFLPMLLLYLMIYMVSSFIVYQVALGETSMWSIYVGNWHWLALGILAVACGNWIGLRGSR